MLKPQLRPSATTNGSTRRRTERRATARCGPFRMTPCYLSAPAKGIGMSAWVYNLSARGVGIIGCQWIEPGTILNVELINAAHTCRLLMQMEVTRIDAVRTGDHYLGGQFTRKLTYDELLPFLI
jgi:hypothetical protein